MIKRRVAPKNALYNIDWNIMEYVNKIKKIMKIHMHNF
jgi:hypothetical protein